MEPRFLEIQEVLGDPKAVAEIGPRCAYLRKSPEACRKLPPHFQVLREYPGHVGKACPLNPSESPIVQAKMKAAGEHSAVLNLANELHWDREMKLRMSVFDLSPGEHAALQESLAHAGEKERERSRRETAKGRRKPPSTVSGASALSAFE